MEVRAALEALRCLKRPSSIVLYGFVIPSQRCDGMAARLETPQLEAKTGRAAKH